MSFAKKLCLSVKSCNKIFCLSYGTQLPPLAPVVGRTLVQDLKYKFRIKSATSDELPAAREGRTPLTTITMKDARSIWILTLVGQHGLPSKKVFLSDEIHLAMEERLREVLQFDEDGLVEFEDYLPTMVKLVKTEVTPEEEIEIAHELFDFWFPQNTLVPAIYGEHQLSVLEYLKMEPVELVKTMQILKKFIPR